jgi:hypothetical protein
MLSKMSIFTERELYTIKSTTLPDELFNSLTILEYYEAETEKYEFILTLKDILPFSILNKAPNVSAENISEVDSIREAMINTLVVSHFNESPNPVSVTVDQIRGFMESLDWDSEMDIFPDELETSVIDVIHELGQGLTERQASLLAKEVIRSVQRFVETIVREWDTVNSSDETVFFKRWVRMALVADSEGHVERILSSDRPLDEFEFESMLDKLLRLPTSEAENLAKKISWNHLKVDQIIRLFHDARAHQPLFAKLIQIGRFSTDELIDLIESLEPDTFTAMLPQIRERLPQLDLRLEDIEILSNLHQDKIESLWRSCNPPIDLDKGKILSEFKDSGLKLKKALFNSCIRSPLFQDLFEEAWVMDPEFVKKEARSMTAAEIQQFLMSASGGVMPEVQDTAKQENTLKFASRQLSSFFSSLPVSKKKAAIKFFLNLREHSKAGKI